MNNTDLRTGLERGWVEKDFVIHFGLKDVDDFYRRFNNLYKYNQKEKDKKIRMLETNKKNKQKKERREPKKRKSEVTEVPKTLEGSEVSEVLEAPKAPEVPEVPDVSEIPEVSEATKIPEDSEEDLQKELKNCENRIVQLEINQADLKKDNKADEKTLSDIQLELKAIRQRVLEMKGRTKAILERVAEREKKIKKVEFDLAFEKECKVELEEKVEAAKFTVVYCGNKSDIKADLFLGDFGLSESEINKKVMEILTIPDLMDLKVHEVKKIATLILVAECGKINFLVDRRDEKIEGFVKEVNKDVKFTYLK